MKTNYIQMGASLICFWRKILVLNNVQFYKDNCLVGCPYFNGTARGEGVECLLALGDNAPIIYTDGEMKDLAPKVFVDWPVATGKVMVGVGNE
jgi:hypothetical protein